MKLLENEVVCRALEIAREQRKTSRDLRVSRRFDEFQSELMEIRAFNEEFRRCLHNTCKVYINKDGAPGLRIDVYVV